LSLQDVNYINAHATSTPAGDMAEVAAIKSVFKEYDHVAVNATKSLIGHGLGAAAGLEAIACIKAIKTGKLHPSLNQDVRVSRLPYAHLGEPLFKPQLAS
jgi:3-oxoacyl-[acyl-carrier-protein] synthase II